MRLADLCLAHPCRPSFDGGEREITALEYDSRREMNGGTLFVCLVGARSDGHHFAPAVYEKGCRAFLVSTILPLPEDAVQILVEDTRAALADFSAAFYGYPARKLHLIGLTGTKGKTSTALMLTSILNGAGKPAAYIGTSGVQIGDVHYETVNTTPESRELQRYFAEMVERGMEYVVMEVSSQALKVGRVRGLTFDTVIFTNFSPDHISPVEHPDLADYIASKSRLFSDYGAAHVVYNADDPMWEEIVGPGAGRMSFATEGVGDISAWHITPYRTRDALGIAFDCHLGGAVVPVQLLTPGEFSVHNALAALAAASVCGVTLADAAAILERTPVQGRFELVQALPERTFILDYAHNGLSLRSALSVLREYHPNRLICVFGSVGGKAQNRRAELGATASSLADYCIVTSDNPDGEDPAAIIEDILAHFDSRCAHEVIVDRTEAVRRAVRMSCPGDIVLFAGKGHETYQIVAGEHVPFSERALIEAEAARMLHVRR